MDKYDRRPAVFQNNALIDCKNRTMNEKQTKLYYLGLRKMVSDLPVSSQEKRPEFTGSLMVYIPKSELVARFGAKWVQNDLYKEVDVMMSKAKIKIKTDNGKWALFNIFSYVTYEGEKLTIKFSDDIAPYILHLTKGCFTKVPLDDVMKLKSVYSVRLLELMLKVINGTKKRKFTYEDLRDFLNVTDGEYKRIDSFKQKVLDAPIKEVNEKTEYLLDYEPTRTGRKITGFDMTIKRKTGREKQEQAKEEKKISAVVKSLMKLDEVVKTAGISEKEALKSLQAKYQLTDKEMMVALKEAKRLKKAISAP